jgi:hypothetical protein
MPATFQKQRKSHLALAMTVDVGVLPTVVSPGAIWAEVEPGFHIELETAIWVDVLPDKRRDGAQVRRRRLPDKLLLAQFRPDL